MAGEINKIRINQGQRVLSVQGDLTLLNALADNDIFLPTACGGNGRCGLCRVRITKGAGNWNEREEKILGPEEKEHGVRLACQVPVRGELEIQIPENLLAAKRFMGRLARKRLLTGDIAELTIELTDPARIRFSAGQFIELETESYANHPAVRRPYSISSPPSKTDEIELIVRRVPGGICTGWIFDHLKEGQSVAFRGPNGSFCLSGARAPLLFIAGGSGMAPIYSILRTMRDEKDITRSTLFFGALTQKDLFLIDEFRQMEADLPNFRFIPALSQEPSGSDWKGERGLITDVVARHLTLTGGHEAYLCGSPGMIEACIKVLASVGIPMENIFFDKFS